MSRTLSEVEGFKKEVGIKPETEGAFREMIFEVGVRERRTDLGGVSRVILHEPIYTPYEVDLNPTQRSKYDDIKELQTLDQKGTPIYSPNVLSMLNRLRSQDLCRYTNKIGEHYDPTLDRLVQEIELIEPSSKLDAVMDILDVMEWDEEFRQHWLLLCFKDPLKLLRDALPKQRFRISGWS